MRYDRLINALIQIKIKLGQKIEVPNARLAAPKTGPTTIENDAIEPISPFISPTDFLSTASMISD
ncbi:MAG: hypothetical protein Q8O99_00130 [bacterium]|nr:hypothetical protein [bacterium]